MDKPPSPPKQNWICTYCTFSNPYPSNFSPTSPIPPCLNCGMPPPAGTLKPESPRQPHLTPSQFPFRRAPTPPVIANGLFPCPRCTFLNHPAMTACEICGEPLISPNLPPILASAEAIDRGVSPAPQPITTSEERTYVRLSFRSGGEKIFLERLKSAISKKAWEVSPVPRIRLISRNPPKCQLQHKQEKFSHPPKLSASTVSNVRPLPSGSKMMQSYNPHLTTLSNSWHAQKILLPSQNNLHRNSRLHLPLVLQMHALRYARVPNYLD